MEIEVGDYVRVKEWNVIGKVLKITSRKIYIDSLGFGLTREQIAKHSKIISEIVEVGDYVNGKLIHKIDKGANYCYLYYGNCKTFVDYQIKTIVTKEQIASIEYKVEEDK